MTLASSRLAPDNITLNLRRRPNTSPTVELIKGEYKCFGIKTKKDLKTVMSSATVMNALSDAVVEAGEHSGTVVGVVLRLYNQKRKTAVLDAIKHELTNRMNARVAGGQMVDGDKPRPPLSYLSGSMDNARRHAAEMMNTFI